MTASDRRNKLGPRVRLKDLDVATLRRLKGRVFAVERLDSFLGRAVAACNNRAP
jgi:hypothetical protein